MKRILLALLLIVSLTSTAQIAYTFVGVDSTTVIFNNRTYYRNYEVVYYSTANQLNVREVTTGFNLTQPRSPQSYLINGVFYRNLDSCGKALLKIITPYGAAGEVLWSDTISTIATQAYVQNYVSSHTFSSRFIHVLGNNTNTYVNAGLINKSILALYEDGMILNGSVSPKQFTFVSGTGTITFASPILSTEIIHINYQ